MSWHPIIVRQRYILFFVFSIGKAGIAPFQHIAKVQVSNVHGEQALSWKGNPLRKGKSEKDDAWLKHQSYAYS
jgi:hypothetical protein